MRNSAFFVSLMAMGFAMLLLFQNCGEAESLKVPSRSSVNDGGLGIDPGNGDGAGSGNNNNNGGGGVVTPAVLQTRNLPLNEFDNTATLEFDIATGDRIHYETDYLAQTRTSLVTIFWSGQQNIITVDAENCANPGEAVINFEELNTLFGSINMVQALPREQQASDVNKPNCAFPRLGLEGLGPKLDMEIYMAERLCVPVGKSYATNQVAEIDNFFSQQMDRVCGGQGQAPPPQNVSFAQQVDPILTTNCKVCHTGAAAAAAYDMSTYNGVISRVTAGNALASLLHQRMNNAGMPMPPTGLLGADERLLIQVWIDEGAQNN